VRAAFSLLFCRTTAGAGPSGQDAEHACPCPLIRLWRRVGFFLALHRQNHAELGPSAHHSCVSLVCLFQGISFDHWVHTRQFGELHGVL